MRRYERTAGAPSGEKYRKSLSPAESRRNFTRHAKKVHYKNVPTRAPMRGGIRL